jgi:hypothetical protein
MTSLPPGSSGAECFVETATLTPRPDDRTTLSSIVKNHRGSFAAVAAS